ncbi:hypothetical protein [Saccharothrix texasensis]|nr:hypothetical protein [Saccharothrix texasensis]
MEQAGTRCRDGLGRGRPAGVVHPVPADDPHRTRITERDLAAVCAD